MLRLVSAAVLLAVSGMSLFALAQNGEQGPDKSGPASESKVDKPGAKAQRQNRRAQAAAQAAQDPPAPPPPTAAEANVPILSSGDSYDDFASVAEAPDGTLYAAYAAYYDAHDQIRLHKRLANGNWSTRVHVPLAQARADVWMPQIAVDAQGRVWVIWSEQTGQTSTSTGNWDIYARAFEGASWGPLVRLSEDPKPDIHPHVALDSKRNLYVVWQGHADNTGDVMLARFDGSKWSKPLAVTSGPQSDWFPQVAVDQQGKAWIAFDSYRNGDYDVFLTSVDGDRVGDIVPIATSRYYEAHPSVACTADGRIWIAWEQAGYNWGKDQGYWLRFQAGEEPGSAGGKAKPQAAGAAGAAAAHPTGAGAGTPLGSPRSVQVAVYHNGKLEAGPDVNLALPDQKGPKSTALPELAAAADGRIWLRFRRANRGVARAKGQFSRYWTEDITYLTDQGWKPAKTLPGSTGRISVFSRVLPTADGGLAVAYSGDQRSASNYHQPIHDYALVTVLAKPEEQPGSPMLADYQPPAPPPGAKTWDVDRERAEVTAARAYRVTIDGQPQRIVRGDLHRHTEMSWDVGPGNDGSYLDFYRYMIDVASMDFGALTDHQGGGHYAYHWWLTEKSADMHYLAPRFVPLYGYERSVPYPNGHRNVFHSYRGVPVFAFQIKLDQTGVFPGVSANNVLDDDTKLLYQYLKKTGGVAISHTSGTNMGTDWRDNDPEIEPVVEIYQGARNSYEVLGAPRVHDISTMRPDQAPGGFQAAGMVWNALAKGYRLGMTSSSDHGSTHISYSLVYTPENDRAAILDAIRKRHTYGATDNLIVEVWAAGHFMGDEFKTQDLPELELKVQATDKIARIDLVRNNQYIYTTSPLKKNVSIKYTDREPKEGLNYYYFRIQQDDGEIAWASPVWVHYETGK